MTDEHVPPPEEELVEMERSLVGFTADDLWFDINYSSMDRHESDEIARQIEFIPRLIAEVRRLRGSNIRVHAARARGHWWADTANVRNGLNATLILDEQPDGEESGE